MSNTYQIHCIISYEILPEEKHKKLAKKISGDEFVVSLAGGERELTDQEQNEEYKEILSQIYEI